MGSSARLATVCYFEPTHTRSWVSKHLKKPIKSTVTCLSWHPNSICLAVGSTDQTCRVYSTWIKDIEPRPSANEWGSRLPFEAVLAEYKLNAWCIGVCFSPSGEKLAITGHNSTVSVATAGDAQLNVHLGKQLPFNAIDWISDSQLVAVGHDRCPFLFEIGKNGDISYKGKSFGKVGGGKNFAAASEVFTRRDRMGQTQEITIDTCHVAPISDLKISVGSRGNIEAFATSSLDGKIFNWPWKKSIAGKLIE